MHSFDPVIGIRSPIVVDTRPPHNQYWQPVRQDDSPRPAPVSKERDSPDHIGSAASVDDELEAIKKAIRQEFADVELPASEPADLGPVIASVEQMLPRLATRFTPVESQVAAQTQAVSQLSGLLETAAPWILGALGVSASGGLGSLAIPIVLALIKRRRNQKEQPDGPSSPQSSQDQKTEEGPIRKTVKPVTVDTPPPPQQIITETKFAPYERDTYAQAHAWAREELVRKYPGSTGLLETEQSLIRQFLAAKEG